MIARTRVRSLPLVSVFGVALLLACSSDDSDGSGGSTNTSSGGGTPTSSTGSASGGGGSGAGFAGSGGATGAGGEEPCAQSSLDADLESKPVDIIVVAGNNGSLSQEIAAVEENLNVAFGDILEASGVDYRVILVSRSGGHQFNICIETPLGGWQTGQCSTVSNNVEPMNNPPKFYHYSLEINATDAWCRLLDSYDGTAADEYLAAPNGWSEWLRPEAAKLFLVLSDTRVNCNYQGTELDEGSNSPAAGDLPSGVQAAEAFDALLLAKSATHFGTADNRNYVWYTIAGLAAKDPTQPTEPWVSTDPVTIEKCTGGGTNPVSPAIGYQSLSVLTGGLRFPVCEYQNFDVVFGKIAEGVIAGVAVACDMPIPEPPVGETIDLNTLEVEFTPAGSNASKVYSRVASEADCVADSFYLDSGNIYLCADACDEVQADLSGSIQVRYGCELQAPN